jgi:hypothetical protein
MSGIMDTGSFPRLLLPGIREIYGTELKQLPQVYKEVFKVMTSDRNFEEYLQLAGIGLASEKAQGAMVEFDSAKQDFAQRFFHITYGKGMRITREAMEDNMAVNLSQLMSKELAKSLIINKEIVHANILNRAFNSSYVWGDGKELCATDHPVNAGGVNRNELSVAADISEAALEQAIQDIYDEVGPDGLRCQITPKRLLINHYQMFTVERILRSTNRVATADNDTNALRSMNFFNTDPIVWRYLTDTDAWFILTDREPCLVSYQRRAPAIDTNNDFHTQDAEYISTERFSCGAGDHRGIFGSPGA